MSGADKLTTGHRALLGLLEQKGIHHEPGSGKPAADPSAPHDASSKGSMVSKLKDKLHMG